MRPATAAATAAVAVAETVSRREPRAPLLGVAPALLGRRLDLLHEQVVVGPFDRDLLADEFLDRLERERARLVHEADRLAARPRARRPADAVHVVLGVLRQVPVDDVAHRLDVQAARGDVGGDQDRQPAFLEVVEDLEPALLVDVAGERARLPGVARQPILEPARLLARVREDQDAIAALATQQAQ